MAFFPPGWPLEFSNILPIASRVSEWLAGVRKGGCTALGQPPAHPASPATKSFLFPSSSEHFSLHVCIGIILLSGMGKELQRCLLTGCVCRKVKNVWARSITLLSSLKWTYNRTMVTSLCQWWRMSITATIIKKHQTHHIIITQHIIKVNGHGKTLAAHAGIGRRVIFHDTNKFCGESGRWCSTHTLTSLIAVEILWVRVPYPS